MESVIADLINRMREDASRSDEGNHDDSVPFTHFPVRKDSFDELTGDVEMVSNSPDLNEILDDMNR